MGFLYGFDQDDGASAETFNGLFHNVNDVQGSQVVRTSLFVADDSLDSDVQGFNFQRLSIRREISLIYAKFNRAYKISYNEPLSNELVVNDLLEQPYYLMMATGGVVTNPPPPQDDIDPVLVPQYHGMNKVVSDAPIIFFG